MIKIKNIEEIDKIFERYLYSRFSTCNGFFYYNGDEDIAILFDTNEKEVMVYYYETGEPALFDYKLLDLIDFALIKLGWRKD